MPDLAPTKAPMHVVTGVLPLAARAHGKSGDIERAAFLLSTLDMRWRDREPFRLHVVSPSADARAVGEALRSTERVLVEVRTEEQFFGSWKAFHGLPGWWKQQVIKLAVPAVLELGPYLTFDADVVCVGDIDSRTFVRDGKLLSQWHRQRKNGWWAATARLLNRPYDPDAPGFDVTPNLLHGALAARVLWRLALGRFGHLAPIAVVPSPVLWLAISKLRLWYELAQARARAGIKVHEDTWTEYALYTLLAGDTLACTHVAASDDMPLLAHSHSIWYAGQRSHLDLFKSTTRPDAPFVVLQSTSGVSIGDVRAAVGRLP